MRPPVDRQKVALLPDARGAFHIKLVMLPPSQMHDLWRKPRAMSLACILLQARWRR